MNTKREQARKVAAQTIAKLGKKATPAQLEALERRWESVLGCVERREDFATLQCLVAVATFAHNL